jgi:DNA-binding transcriptional LysR family regulator
MELRHLRYFVAVAEEGSLLAAAEQRLNTSQPSLSRQIRDLETEIGVKLLDRQSRGVVLTAAGRIFLDHARLALLQVEAATDGARRVVFWDKAVAPTTELHRWFGHRPERWKEFQRRYRAELARNPAVAELRKLGRGRIVTLLTAAPDIEHTHPLVLAAVLGRKRAPRSEGKSAKPGEPK